MHDHPATTPPAALSGGVPMTALPLQEEAIRRRARLIAWLGGAVVVMIAGALLLADSRVATFGLAGLLLVVTAAPAILFRRLAAAQAANARFVEAIECIDQGFGRFDAEERLVLCNRRYREI